MWIGTGALKQCERQMQVLEDRLAATRGAGGLFAPPITLATAQELLTDDAALVEYFLVRDHLVAFVVTRHSIRAFDQLSLLGETQRCHRTAPVSDFQGRSMVGAAREPFLNGTWPTRAANWATCTAC